MNSEQLGDGRFAGLALLNILIQRIPPSPDSVGKLLILKGLRVGRGRKFFLPLSLAADSCEERSYGSLHRRFGRGERKARPDRLMLLGNPGLSSFFPRFKSSCPREKICKP